MIQAEVPADASQMSNLWSVMEYLRKRVFERNQLNWFSEASNNPTIFGEVMIPKKLFRSLFLVATIFTLQAEAHAGSPETQRSLTVQEEQTFHKGCGLYQIDRLVLGIGMLNINDSHLDYSNYGTQGVPEEVDTTVDDNGAPGKTLKVKFGWFKGETADQLRTMTVKVISVLGLKKNYSTTPPSEKVAQICILKAASISDVVE